MLIDPLSVLVAFIRAQLVPIGLAGICLLLLGVYTLSRTGRPKPQSAPDAYDVLNSSDVLLIESAINRLGGANANREAYVLLLGNRLEYLVHKHRRSDNLSRYLGVTALCATNVSLFVTGSGFFGIATVGTAFCVNSIGLVAQGLAMFFNAEAESADTLTLGEKIRLEVQQFIGGSSEYASLADDEAYDLFAR
jgi:hypothetical protein